jgi:hypothetical protein
MMPTEVEEEEEKKKKRKEKVPIPTPPSTFTLQLQFLSCGRGKAHAYIEFLETSAKCLGIVDLIRKKAICVDHDDAEATGIHGVESQPATCLFHIVVVLSLPMTPHRREGKAAAVERGSER